MSHRRTSRRKRQLQLRIRMLLLTLAVLIMSGVAFGGIRSMASTEKKIVEKYYTSVTVPFDETLEDVIRERFLSGAEEVTEYSSYRREVLSINHLEEVGGEIAPQVTPGTSVILPYYMIIPQ
ncbi:MAG: hypothetical protein J5935_00625 [Lachnospiraceae bacterium]|nr:hypothetical protein [Lachnospiraceae bacterium]